VIQRHMDAGLFPYTKRYLGITDDELEAVAQRLNL